MSALPWGMPIEDFVAAVGELRASLHKPLVCKARHAMATFDPLSVIAGGEMRQCHLAVLVRQAFFEHETARAIRTNCATHAVRATRKLMLNHFHQFHFAAVGSRPSTQSKHQM